MVYLAGLASCFAGGLLLGLAGLPALGCGAWLIALLACWACLGLWAGVLGFALGCCSGLWDISGFPIGGFGANNEGLGLVPGGVCWL